jgi:hypothetical protein
MLQQIAKLQEVGAFSPEDVRVLIAAFDQAWASVAASRAPFSEPEQHERAREILAKAIIQSAKAGERDVGALAAAALLQLSNAPLRRNPQTPQEIETEWREWNSSLAGAPMGVKSQAMLEKLTKYWRQTKISPTGGAPTETLSRFPITPTHAPQPESTLVPAAEPGTRGTTYRVWEKDGVWCWEVSSAAGHNLGFGRATSSAKARAAAFQFWLDMQ